MTGVLHISDASNLALHTMVLLASEPAQSRSVKSLAEVLGVSEHHLAKVMQRLGKAGVFVVEYLRRIFWPRGLCTVYPAADQAFGLGRILLSYGLLAGMTALLGRRRPTRFVALATGSPTPRCSSAPARSRPA